MFLKKIGNIRRTLAFQLTLWYTMIFFVSSFGAFAVFYLAVSSVIQRGMDDHLLEEIGEYSSLLTLKAGKGIEDELNVEAESEGIEKMFLRIVTPKGREIFSTNMLSWDNVGITRNALNRLKNGTGISDEDFPHIFNRLYRCDTSRLQPGFGLGLSLAMAIARAHGGDITASSKPGKGSTFTITLPK